MILLCVGRQRGEGYRGVAEERRWVGERGREQGKGRGRRRGGEEEGKGGKRRRKEEDSRKCGVG